MASAAQASPAPAQFSKSADSAISIKVEFTYASPITLTETNLCPVPLTNTNPSGGLESLFHNQKNHLVHLPSPNPHSQSQSQSQPTIGDLVTHLVDKFLADSPKSELFVLDGTVRPGILVLVNDADWELEGEAACVLGDGDEVVFVSTLHGG